jgi:hypothetical protein
VEYWKDGKMGPKTEKVFFKNHRIPLNPLFQQSIIPLFLYNKIFG